MNKKLLALAISAGIMVMGAGYAATWTDQVNINTELKTGYVDMSFEDRGEATELSLPRFVTGDVSYDQDSEATGQNQWDIANVKLSNLYPGAKASVNLKIKNNSTIPVEMRSINDTRSANWGPNNENFKQIGATVRFFDQNGNALQFANTTTYANPWEPNHLKNIELPVGGYATISFSFEAAEGIDEEATYEFKPYAVFQQFNQEPNGGVLVTVEEGGTGQLP